MLLTALALTAFAANSILCRIALRTGEIDPASFTSVRLLSGAVVLGLIVALQAKGRPDKAGDWISGFMLFAYAIAFSFAYLGLTAGTGALVLFGSVQATMLLTATVTGHRPTILEWLGLALALAGLIYLVLPGLAAPPIDSAALMIVAGIAWGVYSLRGRGVADPVATTAGNFVRAAPFAIVPTLVLLSQAKASVAGLGWAVLSGAVTSGIGYVIWYAALPSLGATRAAIVQLLVPIIAAVGGVALLGEDLTVRLAIAAAVTLSGVGIAVWGRTAKPK